MCAWCDSRFEDELVWRCVEPAGLSDVALVEDRHFDPEPQSSPTPTDARQR